jgi:hypothetical protein
MPSLLRRVGFVVESLHDHFDQEEEDPIWITECGRRDWVIFTGDKRIEKNVLNRQAVIEGKCKVFIFTDTNSYAEEWAAAVILGREKIQRLIRRNNGPLYVRIGMLADSHVNGPRFVGTGGPKPKESDAEQEAKQVESIQKPESASTLPLFDKISEVPAMADNQAEGTVDATIKEGN